MMMMKKKWGILASACCCCCNRALMSNFLFCVATATTGDDRAPPKARPSSLFSILFFHFNITRVYLWSLQIPESVRRHKKNGWRTRWWWTVGVKLHLCRGETPLFVFFFLVGRYQTLDRFFFFVLVVGSCCSPPQRMAIYYVVLPFDWNLSTPFVYIRACALNYSIVGKPTRLVISRRICLLLLVLVRVNSKESRTVCLQWSEFRWI